MPACLTSRANGRNNCIIKLLTNFRGIKMKKDENVENVVRQIKENIKMRRESNDPIEDVLPDGSKSPDLDYVKSNWDIQNVEYTISSHRPIIGRLLVWGRKFVHGEIRRYVDLIAKRQVEFNSRMFNILNNLDIKINESVVSTNANIDIKINEKINGIACLENRNTRVDTSDDMKKSFLSDKIMNYFIFEDKYRGSLEDIKNRQSIFLQYFKNCKNVLDIGCGRGEFLSLLKENSICAKGIDTNEDMVLFCKKNNLEVVEIDALSYLDSLKDKSLDGIFSSQVVEHLQPKELIYIIKLSYDKLQFGSYFIAETINPSCVFASQWFHMDLSHIRLIHPETIKFLLESVGFRDIEIRYLSQVSDKDRLDRFTMSENMTGSEKTYLDIMNKNIDKLNSLLYGYQDYAIIGKK